MSWETLAETVHKFKASNQDKGLSADLRCCETTNGYGLVIASIHTSFKPHLDLVSIIRHLATD